MLNDVALLVENTAEQNIHLDIRFDVMLELDVIKLVQNTVTGLFFRGDKLINLLDCLTDHRIRKP